MFNVSMCFSERASIISFFTGILGSLYCFLGKTASHKVFGLFFAFVSLMQIVDYLLWRHKKCDDYNKMVSMVGMILNNMQPIVLALLVMFYLPKANKKVILASILVYLSIIIPYSLQFIRETTCTIKGTNEWTWNYGSLYRIVYTVFVLFLSFLFYILLGPIGTISTFMTFFISWKVYPNRTGSVWCFFVTAIPVIFRLLNT